MTGQVTTWDKEKFSEFLITKRGLSPIVASNYVSRCLRVERVLKLDLQEMTENIDGYITLNAKLWQYAKKSSTTSDGVKALTATLRAAVKSFVEFRWRSKFKSLPRFYRDKVIDSQIG